MTQRTSESWLALDIGGVLLSDGSQTAWRALDDKFGIPRADSSKLWYEEFQPRMDLGQIGESELWKALASLGSGATTQQLRQVFLDEYRPIESGIESLRAAIDHGWRTAFATNNVSSWMQYWAGKYEWFGSVDVVCCSDVIGARKPSQEFYTKLINMTSQQAVFVDDKHENVEAARLAGLKAVLALEDGSWNPEMEF